MRLLLLAPFSPIARERLGPHLPFARPRSFNEQAALWASEYVRLRSARVLVVGCNTGEDCMVFVRLGARRVDGIDVIEQIGNACRDGQVGFVRTSAEQMGVRSDTYDLVFCFATMEHVPRIDLAFPELVRVARPGGVIFCTASPLWNSRYGHHKGELFADYPWIHLRLSEAEINAWCESHGVVDPTGHAPMPAHVAYMLDSRFFNKTPAGEYVRVCSELPDVEVIMNELALDPDEVLSPAEFAELSAKGYSRTELLAVTHQFIGRKLAARPG